MDLPLGIIFGLIAMLAYGLSGAIAKVPIKKLGAIRTIFFRNLFTSTMLLFIVLFFIETSTFSLTYILIAFVISFIGYIPFFTFFKAVKAGKIGVVMPIANSSVVFTVLFSILFYGESLSGIQLLSIILIIGGIMLVSVDFSDLKNSNLFNVSSGVPYALVTCFLWGLVYFLFKIPVDVLGPILSSFMIEFGSLFFSAIHLKVLKKGFGVPQVKYWIYIFFVALTGAIGTLAYNFGIQVADVSIVAALTFANPLVAAVYARLVYKEKLGSLQYSAMGLILLGIILISYF